MLDTPHDAIFNDSDIKLCRSYLKAIGPVAGYTLVQFDHALANAGDAVPVSDVEEMLQVIWDAI